MKKTKAMALILATLIGTATILNGVSTTVFAEENRIDSDMNYMRNKDNNSKTIMSVETGINKIELPSEVPVVNEPYNGNPNTAPTWEGSYLYYGKKMMERL